MPLIKTVPLAASEASMCCSSWAPKTPRRLPDFSMYDKPNQMTRNHIHFPIFASLRLRAPELRQNKIKMMPQREKRLKTGENERK